MINFDWGKIEDGGDTVMNCCDNACLRADVNGQYLYSESVTSHTMVVSAVVYMFCILSNSISRV